MREAWSPIPGILPRSEAADAKPDCLLENEKLQTLLCQNGQRRFFRIERVSALCTLHSALKEWNMPLIFDSHLDLAWNALTWRRDLCQSLASLNRYESEMTDQVFRGRATLTLPEMRRANVAVCLGTLMGRVPYGESALHGSTLDFPTHEQTYAFARGQLGYYEALQQSGQVHCLRTASELQAHWSRWQTATREKQHGLRATNEEFDGGSCAGFDGKSASSDEADTPLPIGLILAMEGADAIMSAGQVEHWFELGLRCTSLVHYGTSAYAVGTGQEGPLTAAGRDLLIQFEQCEMILDTTHLSDTSFFNCVDAFSGPICASHQACRSLVPGQRQFSDEQIRTIVERGGVLGIPCDAWMLYPGWVRNETSRTVIDIRVLADHIDHVCQIAGDHAHVSIGSDLDGGYGTEQTPQGLNSIADLQALTGILKDRGYGGEAISAVMGENWLRFFMAHLPA